MAHYRADRFPEAARELAAAAGPLPLGPFAALAALARQLADFGDEPPYRITGRTARGSSSSRSIRCRWWSWR